MAERASDMTDGTGRIEFDRDRLADLLNVLELIAAGDTQKRLTISPRRDELDAIAHAINVLVGELAWTTERVLEAQTERAVTAERANDSKNIFLRNMSHEIRTPITAMLGFADLLASEGLSSQDRPELLRRLQANGLAVLALLDDLLDLARLDAHRIVLNPEPVPVVDLVREVMASLEVDSRAKGLAMRVEATPDALGVLQTDRYRLRQILVNVLTNAVKFTEAGAIVVWLGVRRGDGDERWTIDVIDTGIGIAAHQHARVFEPFEQASPAISRAFGGSGLGLALSRRLAEQLGGGLALVRSAPGEGSAFRLTLRPLETASKPGRALEREVGEADSTIRGMHILLAEDHRDLHLAVRQFLERAGATVESAYDGRQAVELVASAAFDVLLMDLRMPHTDGFEATRILRGRGCTLPIIALTADPTTMYHEEALEAGCDACLAKPFKLAELSAAIRRSSRGRT
jgi:signal transduction histidine kinase/ActR/RegA family two-component response regulator